MGNDTDDLWDATQLVLDQMGPEQRAQFDLLRRQILVILRGSGTFSDVADRTTMFIVELLKPAYEAGFEAGEKSVEEGRARSSYLAEGIAIGQERVLNNLELNGFPVIAQEVRGRLNKGVLNGI